MDDVRRYLIDLKGDIRRTSDGKWVGPELPEKLVTENITLGKLWDWAKQWASEAEAGDFDEENYTVTLRGFEVQELEELE